ncbi:MAG: type II toxin-antitoxin system death-on-curing family toxin, partial [Candidatus Spechtbacterales bacterium]|nr:type II toxin-antitoxin system death-on-curing family toxin [Candidatus Spechtbacterales bacterium]
VPFHVFQKRDMYKGLHAKAAVLFYTMVKNHPFQNGNKRIALTTLLVFLSKNGKWIHVDTQEFYNFAKWVAASNPKLRKQTIDAVEEFIRQYIVDLS